MRWRWARKYSLEKVKEVRIAAKEVPVTARSEIAKFEDQERGQQPQMDFVY
jgi:hypothetical protein